MSNSKYYSDMDIDLMIAKLRLLGYVEFYDTGIFYDSNIHSYINPDKTDVYSFIKSDVVYLNRAHFDDTYIKNMTVHVIGGSELEGIMLLFAYCTAKVLDISKFDTSKVIDMRYLFTSSKIEKIAGLENLDTSNVYNMSWMFYKCQTSSLNLNNFNTSKVNYMIEMFSHCEAENIDVSSFYTGRVISMENMFTRCKTKKLDISNFKYDSLNNSNDWLKDLEVEELIE